MYQCDGGILHSRSGIVAYDEGYAPQCKTLQTKAPNSIPAPIAVLIHGRHYPSPWGQRCRSTDRIGERSIFKIWFIDAWQPTSTRRKELEFVMVNFIARIGRYVGPAELNQVARTLAGAKSRRADGSIAR